MNKVPVYDDFQHKQSSSSLSDSSSSQTLSTRGVVSDSSSTSIATARAKRILESANPFRESSQSVSMNSRRDSSMTSSDLNGDSKAQRVSSSGTRRKKNRDTWSDIRKHDRMVIAIDYGTTFTGVGYAIADSAETDLSAVQVVSDWGKNMSNVVKIPSVISYSAPTAAEEKQFGADLSPEAITMINTKLELDTQGSRLDELRSIIKVLDGMNNLNFEHIRESRGYPAYTYKAPEDIIRDYLENVFQRFSEATKNYRELKMTLPVDIIVTFPVNWSWKAKNSTFRAIRGAGFNQVNFPLLRRYVMVTEPEAAAIYATKYLQETKQVVLKQNDCFVLCDAGGGTVDVVSYQVQGIEPSFNIAQLSLPTGARCGSSYINAAFKQYLKKQLEDDYRALDAGSHGQAESGKMRKLMTQFESIKKRFHERSPEMRIDLPSPLDMLSVPGRIDEGDVRIPNKLMRRMFEPRVDGIIELVKGQIRQVEDQSKRVKVILLIGGFSESEYLRQQLESSLRLRDVRLYRPETSWSAVVRGAVMYGLQTPNPSQRLMTPCPRNYGLSLNQSYSQGTHDGRDVYTDPLTNQSLAGHQMTWLIRKGDLLIDNETRIIERKVCWQFRQGDNQGWTLKLYEYLDDDAPDRYQTSQTELSVALTLNADLRNQQITRFDSSVNQNGILYYTACVLCRLTVKNMDLVAQLWWDGRVLDTKTIHNINTINNVEHGTDG